MVREKIAAVLDLARPGLEIGALDRPLVTRAMGPVEYVDRAPVEALRRIYRDDPAVRTDRIVQVDHVWGEQTLADCTGGRAYAYVVASHVIEHVPDLFGWLREIAQVLEPGGLAAFVVPDKRYTFDVLRRTSSPAELVDAYVRRLRRPDARQVFDCFYNARQIQSGEAHALAAPAPPGEARRLLDVSVRATEGEYVDAHCWVFTPRSLAQALDLGSQLQLLPFEIAALKGTEDGEHEFMAVLRRLPDELPAEAMRAAFVVSLGRLSLPPEPQAGDPEAEVMAARAQQALARVAAIERSTSWRITAPLRAAATWLRRLAGRG